MSGKHWPESLKAAQLFGVGGLVTGETPLLSAVSVSHFPLITNNRSEKSLLRERERENEYHG